jgi:hypothetical protein
MAIRALWTGLRCWPGPVDVFGKRFDFGSGILGSVRTNVVSMRSGVSRRRLVVLIAMSFPPNALLGFPAVGLTTDH